MLYTPADKLKNYADLAYESGYEFIIQPNNKRAIYNSSKRDVLIELFVDGRDVCMGVVLPQKFKLKRELEDELGKQGFIVLSKFGNSQHLRYELQDLEDLTDMITIVSNLDMLENSGNSWKTTADVDTRIANIIKIIKLAVKTKDTTLLKRDMVDDITPRVTVNTKTEELNYGEHVVPIDYMFQASCEMVRNGTPDKTIKSYWKRNLKVVYITEAQAKILDVDLKLRTVMPDGWRDGDTPYARLDMAEIEII